MLEDLFGAEWFSSSRKTQHPAYQKWALCNDLINQEGQLRFPKDRQHLEEITQLVLDNCALVEVTKGKLSSFELGCLANYGDVNVTKRMKSVIENPSQFLDILVEINYAAWHTLQGHMVQATESEGLPDFEVHINGLPFPLVTDCKRVHASTTDRRFPKLIKKANKQIKNLNKPCYGLAVIDISEKVPGLKRQSSEQIPLEVTRICKILKQSLRQYCRSVSGVLIVWKENLLVPMTDGSGGTLCFIRQHSHLLQHQAPRRKLPGNRKDLMIAYTVMLKILRS